MEQPANVQDKRSDVPLEEALTVAGMGWYTRTVMLVTGLMIFVGFVNAQAMSIVIIASSCDLHLSDFQKGILTSVGYTGMIFSSHLFGFLADTFGRRKVMLCCACTNALITLLSSLAPQVEVLMAAFFLNGFVVGGIFTPGYVYASEFCSGNHRATGLLVASSLACLSNVFLPSLAWLVLPLDIHWPLYTNADFTSWRLYLALLSFPNLAAFLVLRQFPETPKFLLNAGEHAATLEILQDMYACNRNKPRDTFPITSVKLDVSDGAGKAGGSRSCLCYMKDIVIQTGTLFKTPLLPYTLISCVICIVEVGGYNTGILWLPEEARRLTSALRQLGDGYNVTLCNVMSDTAQRQVVTTDCTFNAQTYIPSMAVGLLQFIFFYVVNFVVKLTGGKPICIVFACVASAATIGLIFSTNFYLTFICLAAILVLMLSIFPVALSVNVGYFPTSLRSNATSIMMLVGRIFSVIGAQSLGALFESYCEYAYGGMSIILIGLIIAFIIMPNKRV